jgi:hypothetical protein
MATETTTEDKSFALTADDEACAARIATALAQGTPIDECLTWLPRGKSEAVKARRWQIVEFAREVLARVEEQLKGENAGVSTDS